MAIWSDEDIEALRSVISSAVMTVSFTGPPARTVTYASQEEKWETLQKMLNENAAEAGTRKPYKLAAHKKGL